MTVGELIEELKKCNAATQIIVASDEEGNSYKPCSQVLWGLFDEDYEVADPDDESAKEAIVISP